MSSQIDAELADTPTTGRQDDRLLHWRAGGTSLVVAVAGAGGLLPRIVHWGADLGDVDDAVLRSLVRALTPPVSEHPTDNTHDLTVLPEHARGWTGRPGVEGSRAGRDWSAALRMRSDGRAHRRRRDRPARRRGR